MGKLTEALKKVEKQRETQKQAYKKKEEDTKPIQVERKVAIPPVKRRWEIADSQKAIRRLIPAGLKALEETVDILKERLKKEVYIAKSRGDSGIDQRVVAYLDPDAYISEQYRILRTNVQSKSLNKSAKTFLVSSALHGEGKTITAVNLAVALAQDLDKKVFLLDCDLRSGNIHQLLNLDLSPGLSDILANGTASEVAFHNSKIKNLTVLPRGESPSSPSELLSSRRMRRLLEELKPRYDYIILDSPPVIPVTDASILGAQTDGVVLIVQAQRTQEQTIRRAQELLEQARAKIVGFVLAQVDYGVPGYYPYYRHNGNGNGKAKH